MAKINQYPLERMSFGDDDYYDIDYWDGANYQTAKIKGSTIKAGVSGLQGSGTTDFLARWTPDGSTLGDSILEDNGDTLGVGGLSPKTVLRIRRSDKETLITGVNDYVGSVAQGVFFRTEGVNVGFENIGVKGEARYSDTGNIGGLFEASGTNPHAVRLIDGTEGVDKVLRSDADGYSSWVDVNTLVENIANTNLTVTADRELLLDGNKLGLTGGNTGFGVALPHDSAQVEVSATDKGLLIPRVTTPQMDLIIAPAINLLVFNTDLEALYRYDGSNWVALSAGYGIIEVIRDSDDGVPTFFADLQSALETCKTSGSTNKVTLYSDITITTEINIKSSGSGVGNGYDYESLTIDFNGFTLTNNEADATSCFDVYLGGSSATYRRLNFINGRVNRTSGTGSHYALFSDYAGHYGHLEMSNMIWYCENSMAAAIEIELPTTNTTVGYADFGNSHFYSENGIAINIRDYYCKNFSVLNNSSSITCYISNAKALNFNVQNNSTGSGLVLIGSTDATFFTVKTSSGKGIDFGDDFDGVCSHFLVQTTTGEGIETVGTNATYKLRLSNFEVRTTTGVCIDSRHTNSIFSNFLLSNNGTNSTITVNSNETLFTNGTVVNYGSGQCFQLSNKSDVRFKQMGMVSYGDIVGNISFDNVAYSSKFEFCTFESRYNNVAGHCVDIDDSTGSIAFSNCVFQVANSGANCITASSAETISVGNSALNGATTPINANVTISLTTAPDSNGNYTA